MNISFASIAKTTTAIALVAASVQAGMAAEPAEVTTLASGVKIEFIKKTTGEKPTAQSIVKAHYRGTLTDGKEFDSSYKRGEPIDFPLNGVIPCWTEGVQQMSIGSKVKLTCPGATAYGPRGIPGLIPPNATLHFEVELVGIVKK